VETNELSLNARGGTELMLAGLEKRVDPELLSSFQIIPSRVRELHADKVRVLWCQNLPEDPGIDNALKNQGWKQFHRIVFVSNWQMQHYIERYAIAWDRCALLQNAIEPIPTHKKPSDRIKLVYMSTPQRGLDVLYYVFKQIPDDDIHLEVFSSFKLYGWPQADQPYEPLFDQLRNDSRVTYHGSQDNDFVRAAIQDCHIFAYPSTWKETSCICLMEAMSARLLCVHPDLAALPETASNTTTMYHWDPDKSKHASIFLEVLKAAIATVRKSSAIHQAQLDTQKSYADKFYSWDPRAAQWTALLKSIKGMAREFEKVDAPKPTLTFSYRV